MDEYDQFLSQVKEDENDERDTLFAIYVKMDDWFSRGQFEKADLLLQKVVPEDYEEFILIGFLAASLPAEEKLPSRHALFLRVKAHLEAQGQEPEEIHDLLKGLEKWPNSPTSRCLHGVARTG